MIRVFIGYDEKETAAAHVLHHSIQRRSSMPVQVTFLNRASLRGIYTRPRGEHDTTDFSNSRFLVPHLCNYEGYAVFMDCDMVCRDDIAKLWAWRDERYALRVVKHNYKPTETTKAMGAQTRYQRKNWSSVMLFNNAKCNPLTLDYVNTAPGLELHQFRWLLIDDWLGELPHQWNHLVGHDAHDDSAALVHYTTGGPYFKAYKHCEYSADWKAESTLMNTVAHD